MWVLRCLNQYGHGGMMIMHLPQGACPGAGATGSKRCRRWFGLGRGRGGVVHKVKRYANGVTPPPPAQARCTTGKRRSDGLLSLLAPELYSIHPPPPSSRTHSRRTTHGPGARLQAQTGAFTRGHRLANQLHGSGSAPRPLATLSRPWRLDQTCPLAHQTMSRWADPAPQANFQDLKYPFSG